MGLCEDRGSLVAGVPPKVVNRIEISEKSSGNYKMELPLLICAWEATKVGSKIVVA